MDASAYTATVTVEDVDAKLTVTGVTVKKDGDAEAKPIKAEVKDGKVNLATFTNSYAAKGSVTLAAKKRFTGGALAGNDFSFALYKGDKAEGTPIETVTNDEKGNITFQPINYTEAGDYEYTIKEVTGNDQTIVYDGQKVKVKVSVTDNKNGTLDATVTYGGDKAVPTFTNVKPTTDVTVEATKVLAGKALTDGAFAFGLYQGDTSTGNPVKIVQNDKEGKINLALTGLTIGEYDYKLKEENVGADPTITYDTKAVKVHVSVKAEGDKAKATVTYDGKNDAPTFTNKYQPAETSVALTAKKAYVKPDNTPATLKGGEFTFDLYEGDLTAEQLFYMCNISLKYFVALPVAILFISATDPSEFAASLNSIGISYKVGYSVAIALRYIPDIQRDYHSISQAQQARGVELGRKEPFFKRLKNSVNILLPLILTSLNRIDTISNAMELRGFGKKNKRTWYTRRPFARRDFIALAVGVVLLLISLTVTIRFGRFYNPFV